MSATSKLHGFGSFIATLALCGLAAPMGTAYANTTDLATTPPDVAISVAPNIAVTFDDSGSMGSTHLPDGLDSLVSSGKIKTQYYFSSNSNSQYYNPAITYQPPLQSDGVTRFPDSKYMNAPRDGICYAVNGSNSAAVTTCAGRNDTDTFLVDLSSNFRSGFGMATSPTRAASLPGTANIDTSIGPKNSSAAFYYKCPTVNSNSNCTLFTITDAEEQNFANWYSYYRTRNLSSRSAIANVFATLKSNIRVVWQTINTGTKLATGTTKFQPFAGDSRLQFFSWLYAVGNNSGTESRSRIDAVGKVFSYGKGVKGSTNPYWEVDPSDSSKGSELSCRLNYSLLVTDGYWNGSASNLTPTADYSRGKISLPDGVTYPGTGGSTASKIFWNVPTSGITTMADIALYYWATNLRPDFKKADGTAKLDVPPSITDYTDENGKAVKWDGTGTMPDSIYFNPANDVATWPHVVQYMIALGISGTLNFPGDYAQLRAGTKQWPKPSTQGNTVPENLDDTWHAAINSRGQYFSARDPATLSTALQTLLSRILGRNSSGAPGALSTAVLTGDGVVYETGYNSANYSGSLKAKTVDVDGNVSTNALWSAGDLLAARAKAGDSRVIITSTAVGAGNGAAFTSTGAGTALTAADPTIDANMIAYLRGDTSNEGTLFRVRASTLGAIINSQVAYVGAPTGGYKDTFPAGSAEMETENGALKYSYEKFVSDHAKRAPTVYVGANDGMLHAFDATLPSTKSDEFDLPPNPGKERWAYVPFTVYDKLSYLTPVSNFTFRPTVDGAPVTRDVFFRNGDKGWHTILVGGLRLGGRGVYALDVTEASASEADAKTKVLWEFNNTSTGGANLGYTYGRPNIGRLANGKWVVLVPSGYFPSDTTSKPYDKYASDDAAKRTQSSLFVLDAQTGEVIKELVTPDGDTSYGLSTPVIGDYENDQVDDVAFAGDLVGNLWRFDLSDADPANWKVKLLYKPNGDGTDGNPAPEDQPITVMPRLFPDPTSSRFMVVFGTGKYLSVTDNTATDATKVQSVYGIRDRGPDSVTVAGRSTLIPQLLSESGDARGLTQRPVPATSEEGDTIDGWYIDLKTGSGASQTNKGERVVVDATALFDSGRAIITSLIPGNDDPCNPVRRGAILVIDAATGGAASGVDVGSGSFGSGTVAAGIRVENVPISGSLPAATSIGGGRIVLPGLIINSDGGGGGGGEGGNSFGIDDAVWRRRSWRELNNGL
ncbi:pilus assembly protein [Luteibacter sp.]|uniref:pilus assembly protein n=1 Tax=Luteibacter sp. TaxID=1886636 RepID=UPI002F3F8E56